MKIKHLGIFSLLVVFSLTMMSCKSSSSNDKKDARLSGITILSPTAIGVAKSFSLGVQAVDQDGKPFEEYSGTVTVSGQNLTSATGLTLVFDGTQSSMFINDAQFSVVGDKIVITATDGDYTATAEIDVYNPGMSTFKVEINGVVRINTNFIIKVTAVDQKGADFPAYAGAVTVSAANLTGTLALNFPGGAAMQDVTDAQFSAVSSGATVTATDGTYTGRVTVEVKPPNNPPSVEPTNNTVTVSNADAMPALNGTYRVDGINDGKTLYKHENSAYYIFYDGCPNGWKIYDTYGNREYYWYRNMNGSSFPGSGRWGGEYCGISGTTIEVSAPSVTGTLDIGETLSIPPVRATDPDGDFVDVMIKWYRCDDTYGSNDVEIDGPGGETYRTSADDRGKYIKCEVTPVDAYGLDGDPVSFATQSAIDAPAYYIVTGADMSDVNGQYDYIGIYNNHPLYYNAGYYIIFAGCSGGYWRIYDGFATWGYFYSDNDYALPELNGWSEGCNYPGVTPAPPVLAPGWN